MSTYIRKANARRTRTSKEITTATYQIKAGDHGKTLMLKRAAGITLTLPPDDIFEGFTIKMIVRGSFSGNWEVTCETDGDLFFGGVATVSVAAKADYFKPNGSSNDTFKADSDNKGRLQGGWIEFTLMGANEWLVNGTLMGGGTPATAFADT